MDPIFRNIRLQGRIPRTLLIMGTFFAALGNAGCLFETRTPEKPLDVDVDWIQPFQPENVLTNMKDALEAKYRTNYDDSLHEDFVFYPSNSDVLYMDQQPNGEGYFDNWDKARELNTITTLFTRVASLDVEWNYDNDDLQQVGDSATFYLESYVLTVIYDDSDEAVIYTGYAELKLVRESEWRLVSWNESPSVADQSWGRLRAELEVWE